MASWIKIFRELLQWEWLQKPEMVQLFIYLLLKANCEDKQWQGITVKRGQLVASNSSIRNDLKLSEQTIRTCIKRLISTGEITYKSTNRYAIITICNYDKYQDCKDEANEQINEQSTSNQRAKIDKINEQINEQDMNISTCESAHSNGECFNINEPTNEQSTSKSTTTKEYINIDNHRLSSKEYNSLASIEEFSENPKTDRFPTKEIKEMWNTTCTGFPKLFTMSEARKNKMRLRIAEMGGLEKALPLIKQIFEKTQQSRFLKGDNRRGWKASFDWLFENDKNWVKVYEGNYDNKPEQQTATRYGNNRNCNDEWT